MRLKKKMIVIIKTLSDTQLPALLVVGGLIFLLVPFVPGTRRTTGTETTNKVLATFLGTILLVSGIGLYVLPALYGVTTTDIAAKQSSFPVVITATSVTKTESKPAANATEEPTTESKPTATPTQQQCVGPGDVVNPALPLCMPDGFLKAPR
jgi:hypothetical protein